MAWNTRNKPTSVVFAQKRLKFKQALAWAWIKENHPNDARKIEDVVLARYPWKQFGRPRVSEEVVDGLKKLRGARKAEQR